MLKAVTFACLASTVVSDWSIIASDVGTIATGVAFTDANTGYLPVSQNGAGTSVQKSTDGGKTWNEVATEPFALLLLDVAAFGNSVAVIGALSLQYSINGGLTYNTSLGPLGAGQCIRTIGVEGSEAGYAAVGQWGLINENNGPAVSFDLGITYSAFNVTSMVADARYGAFPDKNTWFLTAGDWPGEGADDDPAPCDDPPCGTRRRTSGWKVDAANYNSKVVPGSKLAKVQGARIHVLEEPSGKLYWATVKQDKVMQANYAPGAPITGYEAQLAKSADSGKSWSIVYSNMGEFYFNGIECTSDTQCCAVAEFSNNATSGGSYVWCTQDGGNTWNDTFYDTDPNSSLVDIAAVGPNEYWAVGGEMGLVGFKNPSFYHTVDGGVTWVLSPAPATMAFMYAIAVDCADGNCWANLLDVLTQESSIASLN